MADEFNDYTVVLKDYSEHPQGFTRVVFASGRGPENAAGEAECGIAIEIWKRRYPHIDHLASPHEIDMEDEWMACMEAVHTLAVIDGTPTVWFEDGIYFPDDDSGFVVNAPTHEAR
jgi:hypothetical protein